MARNEQADNGSLPTPDGAPGIIGVLSKIGGGLSKGIIGGGNILGGQPAGTPSPIQPQKPPIIAPAPAAAPAPASKQEPAPVDGGLTGIYNDYNNQRRNDFLNNLTGALDARFAGRINQ